MKAKMIRQGDVLLIPLADENQLPIPQHGSKVERGVVRKNRVILAEGETSLHEHTLNDEDADLVRIGERMLLNVYRDTRLVVTETHTGAILPRHTPIELPGGLYEVRIQRELVVQPAGMPQRWTRVRD